MKPLLAAILSLAVASTCLAAELRGKVVAVVDGDTIDVLDETNATHRIRLNAIDAPEKGQAFGTKSREALADKIAGQSVLIEWIKRDRYGRTLGTVTFDGRDINAEMIQDGWAWHYREYSKSKSLQACEDAAREKRCGLWAGVGADSPVAPWEWRKAKKKVNQSSDAPAVFPVQPVLRLRWS